MSTVSTTLTGTSSSDTIKAGSGDDIINAGAGDDTVRAGAGNDTVDGGTGNDVIYGEAGNDTLDGGAGSDWVDGGAGNDFFIYAFEASASRDTYIGGSGRDALQIRISKVDADRSGLSQQIAAFTQVVSSQITPSGELSEGKPATFTFTFWNGSTLTVSTIESAVVFITDSPATGSVTLQSAAEGLVAGMAVNLTDPDGPITQWSYALQVKVGSGDWQTVTTTSDPASLVIPDDQALVDGLARVRVTTTDSKGGITVVDSNAAVIANVDDAAQGVLKLAGAASEGGGLTATLYGATDIDGAITSIGYQWQREVGGQWQDISGASTAILSIPDDQSMVGQHVRVVATTTDARGGTTQFTQDVTIANVDDPTTGMPVITNTSGQPVSAVLEGATLRADLSGLQDADGLDLSTATYAWQRLDPKRGGWQPLRGLDGLPLTTAQVNVPDTQAWVGQTIRVVVSVSDAYGGQATAASREFVVQNVDDPATGRFVFDRDTQFVEGQHSRLQLLDVWDLDNGPAPDPMAGAAVDTDAMFHVTYQLETSIDGQQWTAYGTTYSHATDVLVPSEQEYVGQQVRIVAVTTDRYLNTTRLVSTDFAPGPVTIQNADDEATIEEFKVSVASGGFGGGGRAGVVIADDSGGAGSTPAIPLVPEGGKLRVALAGWTDEDNTPAFQPFDPNAIPVPPKQVTYQVQVYENGAWVTQDSLTQVKYLDTDIKYLATLDIPADQAHVGELLRVVATSEDLLGGTTSFTSDTFQIANVDDEAHLSNNQPLTLQGTTLQDGQAVAFESVPGQTANELSVDLNALGLSDEDGAITALAMQWFVTDEYGDWYPRGDLIEWAAPQDGSTSPYPIATLQIPDSEELVGRQVMLEIYTQDALGGTSRLQSNPVTVLGVTDITGDLAATLVETNSVLSTHGKIVATSGNGEPLNFVPESVTTPFGIFDLKAGGDWSYTTRGPLDSLSGGVVYGDNIEVVATDGSKSAVAILIQGTDDVGAVSYSRTVGSGQYTDTAGNDTFAQEVGKLIWLDRDNRIYEDINFLFTDLATGQSGRSLKTAFGTLSIVPGQGTHSSETYTFTPDSSAIQALGEGQTGKVDIKVSLSDYFAALMPATAATMHFTFTGANDAATITGTSTGTVTEDGTLSTGGTLAIVDRDQVATTFAPLSSAGAYGNFNFDTSTGQWSYLVDNTKTAVQALDAGQSLTDTVTVTTVDGTASQDITVTIQGVDEPAPSASLYIRANEEFFNRGTTAIIRLPADVDASGLHYQWWSKIGVNDWTPIAGATSLKFAIPSTETFVGRQVQLTVADATGHILGTSNAISELSFNDSNNLLTSNPIIQNQNIVYAPVAPDIVDADGGTITASYLWRIKNASGAFTVIQDTTDSTLDLAAHGIAAGTTINVVVSMIDSFGANFKQGMIYTANSFTSVLAEPPAVPSGTLAVSGKAAVGETLTVSPTNIAADPGTTFSHYGWDVYREGVWTALDSSGSNMLTLGADLVAPGEYVRARADAITSNGTLSHVYSIAQRLDVPAAVLPDSVAKGFRVSSMIVFGTDDKDIISDAAENSPAVGPSVRFVFDGQHAFGPVDDFLQFTPFMANNGFLVRDQIYLANDPGSAFQNLPTASGSLAGSAFQIFDSTATGGVLPTFSSDLGIAVDKATGAVWLVDANGPDTEFLHLSGSLSLVSATDFGVGSLASASSGW